jgi:hypothetical protein
MLDMIPPTKNDDDNHNNNNNDHKDQETLLQEATIMYTWGTHTAQRQFCKTCGILPWYRPRSNPDGYAITLNCVDWGDSDSDGNDNNNDEPRKRKPTVEIKFYNGQNWEDSHTLTNIGQLSKT